MCGFGRTFAIAALCCASAFPALAAECGPLKQYTSIDTVAGPNGYMLVPVKIGDAQRLLLFDTGGSVSGITQAAAKDLHLNTYDSRVKLIGVSGAVSTRYTIIPSLSVGTVEAKSAVYMILPNDMAVLSRGGVIGALAPSPNMDIDLDFAGKKLSLFSTDHCDGHVVYWQATTVAVVPMRIAGLKQGPGLSVEHVIVPVTLDGKKLDALIDTGSATTVLNLRVAQDRLNVDVTSPEVEQIGQLGKNTTAKIYRRRFGALSFEGVTVTNPMVVLMPDEVTRSLGDQRPTGSLTRPSDTGLPELILGMSVLNKMHMYIAYRERKVYITAANDPALVQPASLAPPPGAAEPSANLSGSWKIDTRGGPVPVCTFIQAGSELKGSCVGPQAKGDLAGALAGQTVRWQWVAMANANNRSVAWNFSGTLAADNTITGFAEQNGRSLPFTATKQ